MDLSAIVAETRDFEVLHPKSGDPIGLTLKLRPYTAPEIKAVERRWQTQALRGRKFSADQIEARGTDILVAYVSGWAWGKDADGEPCTFKGEVPEFNEASLRRVLKELPWLKKQLDVEAGSESDFFKG